MKTISQEDPKLQQLNDLIKDIDYAMLTTMEKEWDLAQPPDADGGHAARWHLVIFHASRLRQSRRIKNTCAGQSDLHEQSSERRYGRTRAAGTSHR